MLDAGRYGVVQPGPVTTALVCRRRFNRMPCENCVSDVVSVCVISASVCVLRAALCVMAHHGVRQGKMFMKEGGGQHYTSGGQFDAWKEFVGLAIS